MSLLLAVESTSGRYSVAVGQGDSPVTHAETGRDEPDFAGLGQLAGRALAAAGASVPDVDQLAVDIGPGNLSSVRAAVAYVNGLAFSLGITAFCANSLELLAAGYQQAGSLPVLCMRKASGGNAYLGLYQGMEPVRLTFGPLEPSVIALCRHVPALAVAGGPADVVAKYLPESQVEGSCVEHPSVDILYQLARTYSGTADRTVAMAHPLNEGSPIFHEQSDSDLREN
jgi:tRNA A37 threonylcarbamoyladenosine modification protein TsaB